ALLRNGSVVCWGNNTHGQLGDGTRNFRNTPAPVKDLSDVVVLGVGDYGACATKADSTVWCWGLDVDGFIDGDTSAIPPSPNEILLPRKANRLTDIADFALMHSGGLSCARTVSGVARCWGGNLNGDERGVFDGHADVVDVPNVQASRFIAA